MDGIIWSKYAIDKNNKLINWQKTLEGRYVSKHFAVSTQQFFLEKVEELDGDWRHKFMINIIRNAAIPKQLYYMPLVTIIMSVKNGEQTIINSIKSISKQSYKNVELIIIDDKSTDKTVELIEQTKVKVTLKLLKNEENRGCYYSRNRALSNANGEIIGIQDADDLSDKYRIQKSVECLLRKNVDFVLANGRNINNLLDNVCKVKVTMATFVCKKDFFAKYGTWDENTRHSGDLEILDRAYFKKYGEYKFKNFWYWLNYTDYQPDFYYHIYEDLYFIGTNGERITKTNGLKKRVRYLNERRNYFLQKNVA